MARILIGRAGTRIQAQILEALRDSSSLSRVQLADRLALSRTTIAAELGRLIEAGLVTEVGRAASNGGRRSTLVDLSPDIRFVAIDIGATSIGVALTDGRIGVIEGVRQPCDVRSGPEEVLAVALDLANGLLDKHGVQDVFGVGVGVPGPIDFVRGVPVSPPLMPGWDGYPVRDALARSLSAPVVVDNDVNVRAFGEQHAGVARAAGDFLYVKIGTGIGCGIVVSGRIYRGAAGCAGDIGHVHVDDRGPLCSCGDVGCLEAYFGGSALARDAEELARSGRSEVLAEILAERGQITAADVGTAVSRGDASSLSLVREGGRRVGEVLAALVSFFNPGMIVIGGGVTQIGHLLLAEIRGVTYRRSLPLATGHLPIVLSELGSEAGVIGAARLISSEVYDVASPR